MATYNSIITQDGSEPNASSLIPIEYSQSIIEMVPDQSAAMQTFRSVNMGSSTYQIPVMDTLPYAYWASNAGTASPSPDFGGLAQTTEMGWRGVTLTAQELAVVVPVPKTLLQDNAYNLWGEIAPRVAEAFGKTLDQAVFFGLNTPFTNPALIPATAAVGAVVNATQTATQGGYAAAVVNAINSVEANSGFEVNGAVVAPSVKSIIRNNRDTLGQQIGDITTADWYGIAPQYGLKGLWPVAPSGVTGTWTTSTGISAVTGGTATDAWVGLVASGTGLPANDVVVGYSGASLTMSKSATTAATASALTFAAPNALVGDFTNAILGYRQDLEYTVLDQAVIQDNTGAIVLNLAQQNAVALRVVGRFGYAVSNPVTWTQRDRTLRFPFALIAK